MTATGLAEPPIFFETLRPITDIVQGDITRTLGLIPSNGVPKYLYDPAKTPSLLDALNLFPEAGFQATIPGREGLHTMTHRLEREVEVWSILEPEVTETDVLLRRRFRNVHNFIRDEDQSWYAHRHLLVRFDREGAKPEEANVTPFGTNSVQVFLDIGSRLTRMSLRKAIPRVQSSCS